MQLQFAVRRVLTTREGKNWELCQLYTRKKGYRLQHTGDNLMRLHETLARCIAAFRLSCQLRDSETRSLSHVAR